MHTHDGGLDVKARCMQPLLQAVALVVCMNLCVRMIVVYEAYLLRDISVYRRRRFAGRAAIGQEGEIFGAP